MSLFQKVSLCDRVFKWINVELITIGNVSASVTREVLKIDAERNIVVLHSESEPFIF